MRFGDHEFDEKRWELRREGEPIAVQRKALEILAYLCRNAGRVVSAAELQRAVWGETSVTGGSLRQAMLQLRRALGADAGRVVVNVRGVGYRIGVPVAPSERAGPAEGTSSEFVGRQGEMLHVEAGLASARGGAGRIALATGEPGIGKTRLAEEVARLARGSGFYVAFARCSDEAGAPEFWPWIQVFRGPSSLPPLGDGSSPASRAELEALFASTEKHPMLTPAQAQFRLFDAVRTRLHAVSERAPVALIFDDLHWADGSSLRLLRFVARSLRDARLFVLGTYRDAPVDLDGTAAEILAAISCIEGARSMPLSGLASDDVARLLTDVLPPAERQRESERLRDWTRGNPLFVVRLLPLLHDASRGAASALPLAQGVRAAVATVVGRVRPELRDFLAMAAVAGVEFRVSVLARALGIETNDALALLDEALAGGIVNAVSDDSFRFVHALLRDVLYAEAEAGQRAARHRALARALERRGASPSELAHHLGLSGAEGRAEAARYARAAGSLARDRLAYDEAVMHFRNAREWLEQSGSSAPSGSAAGHAEDVLEVLLDLGAAESALGRIADSRATFREAARLARSMRSGRRLAEVALALAPGFFGVQTGVHDAYLEELLREALDVLGESAAPGEERSSEADALRARLMGRLGMALYYTPHREERERLGERSLALARATNDASTLAFCLVTRHGGSWSPDNLEQRLLWVEEAIALARTAEDADTACVARCFAIVGYLEAGDLLSIDREIQALRDAAQTHGGAHLYELAYQAMRAFMEGRFDEVERVAFEYLAIGERIDDHNTRQAFGIHLAFTRMEQGRVAEVVEQVAAYARRYLAVPGWRAVSAFMSACNGDTETARRELSVCGADGFALVPRDNVWLGAMAFCADATALLDDERHAAVLHDLLAPYADRFVPVGHAVVSLGSVERYLGLMAMVLSREPLDAWHERARAHLTRAIERNDAAGVRVQVAWAQADLGLLLSRERHSEASRARSRELLAAARQTATALGMTRLIRYLESGGSQRFRSDPLDAANPAGSRPS